MERRLTCLRAVRPQLKREALGSLEPVRCGPGILVVAAMPRGQLGRRRWPKRPAPPRRAAARTCGQAPAGPGGEAGSPHRELERRVGPRTCRREADRQRSA